MNTPNPLIKALIAEDNLLNSYLLAQMLQRWTISADMTVTGQETIEKSTQKAYDIIFMDLQMPDMQGFEIAEAIRQPSSLSANVPIVLTTATQHLEAKIHSEGLNAYLIKPFSLEDVAHILTLLLGKNFSIESEIQQLLAKSYDVIDLTYLRKLSNENIGFIRSMATTFCRQSPVFLEQLTHASYHTDWDSLRKIAHKMKPTVAMMGMREAESLLSEMEDMDCVEVNSQQIKKQLNHLERLCQEAFVELADWRND